MEQKGAVAAVMAFPVAAVGIRIRAPAKAEARATARAVVAVVVETEKDKTFFERARNEKANYHHFYCAGLSNLSGVRAAGWRKLGRNVLFSAIPAVGLRDVR